MASSTTVSRQLAVTYERVKRCLDGLTDGEARRLPDGRLTPVVWQVGHLAYVDSNYVQRGGGAPTAPARYADLFKPGTGGEQDYPPLDEVWAAFDGAQQGLLGVAREADYAAPLDYPAYKNVGEMLVYACFHRGYHVGKMATLRALLGKPLPR